MPTVKSAADAATAKKKKSSKDKDVKEKKEKSGSSSKEKEKSDKKESSKKKKSSPADEDGKSLSPALPVQPQQQQPYDADAVQLFRRYDRARTGMLLRCDFLQLLRDYAQPPTHPRLLLTPRQPLSLTDSQGIPLGYERSDKNSEFEAGQLFERYDKDHTGTLSMDKFLVFFNDFRTQLRGFVDDLSYASTHAATAPANSTKPDVSAPSQKGTGETDSRLLQPAAPPTGPKLATSVRAAYQATLWELRKICKDELQGQRERILDAMDKLRARMATSPRTTPSSRSPRGREDPFAFRPTRLKTSMWDNQLVDRHDALESDGERVDEILRLTRRQLRKGMDVSTAEMEDFLRRAPELMADARELAMKVYETHALDSRQRRSDELREKGPDRDERSPRRTPVPPKEADARPSATQAQSAEELQKTLRIKDQIIYQLLQERTTLRKQKSAMEADLHDLTEVSTHEMRKWAQLTDDMQAEIARLRERLDQAAGR